MTEVFICDDFELAALGGCLKGRNGLCSNAKRKNCPYFKEKNMDKQDKPRLAETGDAVNHPAHYTQGGIECIEALKAATAGLEGIEAVCTANAIKYLWRWKHKGGAQDLDKAIWYIKRLKEEVERGERDE